MTLDECFAIKKHWEAKSLWKNYLNVQKARCCKKGA
nr:MAG TPA: hypothetical protein [Caudoviricetes sp.]